MKLKHSLLPVILFSVLAAQILPVGAADTSIIQVSAENIYLSQGQENSIEIKLKNTGDYKCYDVEAFLTSATPGLSILSDAQKVYNEIDKDKTKTYEPTIFVDESLPLGTYTLSLNIIYRRFGGVQDTQVTVPVTVIVDEAYVPMIKYSGNNGVGVSAGDEATLIYYFVNNMDTNLTDIEFTLSSPTSQITVLEGEYRLVEELAPGEVYTMEAKVQVLQGTPLTSYELTATASYMDGNRHYQSYGLPLVVDSERPGESTTVTLGSIEIEDNVRPGNEFNVDIMIEASGADAYDVMAVLGGDMTGSISSLSPTTIWVGDIPAGETAEVSYSLLAKGDISAGQYPLSLTLSYTDNQGMPGVLSETATIQVEGMIEFMLLDAPTIDAQKGMITELEADLLLIGTESVDFVSLDVVESPNIEIVSGSEEYIGAVDPDSPIPFDVTFKVNPDAPYGEDTLELRITYRDHLNLEHTESLETKIDIIDPVTETTTENIGLWGRILRFFGLR